MLGAIAGLRQSHARVRPAILIAGLVAAATLGVGCGGGDETTTSSAGSSSQPVTAGVYVGLVEGSDAYIALISDGDRITGGYLTDSNELSTWLSPAALEDGSVELIARRGEGVGEVTFAGDTASGTVTVAGGSRNYNAALAKGKAGLYRTDSGEAGEVGFTETGWIVLPDGSVRARTNINGPNGFETKPAPSSPKNQVTDFADPYGF